MTINIEKSLKRINRDEDSFKEELFDLYYNQKLSQYKISEKLQVGYGTICLFFKHFDFSARQNGESVHLAYKNRKKEFSLSEEHLQILDGLMLGDGSLRSRSPFTASYRHTSKPKETLESIRSSLPLHFQNINIKKNGNYYMESLDHYQLKSIYDRWYSINGVKIIPEDLKLTSKSVYWWFIGDGSLTSDNRDCFVRLCTECFSFEDHQKLILGLNNLNINASLFKNKNSFRIRIPRTSLEEFYDLIGPCKNPEYAYKWNWIPPKGRWPK